MVNAEEFEIVASLPGKRPITPLLAVDIIIEMQDWYPIQFGQQRMDGTFTAPIRRKGIVLIERLNNPQGLALPGGFVDVGETTRAAAIREAKEEVGLDISSLEFMAVYDDPNRDPRGHTVSIIYIARAVGTPKAASDAKIAFIANPLEMQNLWDEMCFDHKAIITDYITRKMP